MDDPDPRTTSLAAEAPSQAGRGAFDSDSIRSRLAEIARRDRQRAYFGASAHDYRLNPPLDVARIEEFERRHGVRLPEDYRYCISTIGDGGAGPAYGLLRFGHDEFGPWEAGRLVGDFGQPFPHSDAWNLPREFWAQEPDPPPGISQAEEDRLMEEWDRRLLAEYWNPARMNGAIPICELGCGLGQWLVIQGEQRGFIWNDERADNAGVSPFRNAEGSQVTFAEWYLDWLEKTERASQARVLPPISNPARRLDLLTVVGLIVVALLVALLREWLR